jgi:tetratricopeptide (TPR) repeat protein
MSTRTGGLAARVLAAGLALPLAAGAQPTASDESTQDFMDEIIVAMQVVLPPSLDEDRFQDPQQRAAILAALAKLASYGAGLESHGEGGEAGFAFLSHSLAQDTREVKRRYAAGLYSQARFLLHHVTDVCVACHSRLPDDSVRPLGRVLITDAAVKALPADERAQFEMATRQFDAAAISFEALFADPDASPADLDLMGPFEGYLELCLRVRHDPERAIRTFQRFARRDDLPDRVRRNVEAWIASLQQLRDAPPTGTALEQARTLISQAQDRDGFPDDRRALVPFIAASGVLHRYVSTRTHPDAATGEAYYRLGLIEANVGRTFWASETEHYLEAAIRVGPAEPYADDAFALLEEFVVAGYRGSPGTQIPPSVTEHLAALRELIDSAQGREP